MRRVTSIVALLTCVLALQAQPSVRYWFDQQPSKQVLAAGATSLDCSSLPTGIHFAHFQVADSAGMLGPVRSQAFLVLGENLTPLSPSSVRYWFDQQPSKQVLAAGATSLDCSSLPTGIHFVHFQVADSAGMLGPVRSQAFLVLGENLTPSSPSSVRYWFDQQPSRQVLAAGATSLDCSSLPTGIHFAHFQVADSAGMLGPVRSQAFLVLGENLTPSSPSSVRYWFDQQPSHTVYAGGAIDCLSLSNGIHALHLQLVDGDDRPCPVRTHFFVNLDFNARRLSYWFDNDSTRCLMDIDGTEIPVDSLSNGAHTLHVQLADAHGGVMSAETMTAAFTIVCPDGEHVDADHDGLCDVCGEPFCYARTIVAGSYGTLCLPRGADAGRFSGATFYSVAGKRTDAHGNPLSVVLRQTDALAAGTPYFFVGSDSLLQVDYSGDAVSDTVVVNGLTGTLAGCAVPEGMYLLDGDELAPCGVGSTLGACRAYLDMAAVPDYEEGQVEPDRMAVIAIAGADADALRALHVEGDAVPCYDLSGLRIPRDTRGITIVNGRKVLSR